MGEEWKEFVKWEAIDAEKGIWRYWHEPGWTVKMAIDAAPAYNANGVTVSIVDFSEYNQFSWPKGSITSLPQYLGLMDADDAPKMAIIVGLKRGIGRSALQVMGNMTNRVKAVDTLDEAIELAHTYLEEQKQHEA